MKDLNNKKDLTEEINGIKISDPYRWLENSKDPEVQNWIKKQNDKVYSDLKNDSFDVFSKELADNFKVINFSNPILFNGKYFYVERQPDEDQSVLYVKNGLDGEPIKLVDPNGKRNGNTITIDYWHPSSSGKYLAYGLSEGGDEKATLYVKDVDTNQGLSEKITNCRYASVRWLSDDSGFFYKRNPRPGTVSSEDECLYPKVYFHKLGDNPDSDELIFGKDRPKDDMLTIGLSVDDRYLSIEVSQTWTENEVYIYDVEKKETELIISGIFAKFSVFLLEDKILLLTNYKADKYRVLWNTYDNLHQPVDDWKELIPESDSLLQKLKITKSKILAEYLVNACSKIVIFDYEGIEIGEIPLPSYSSLTGISARKQEEDFFYGVDSFVFPKITYRYDFTKDEYLEYRKTDNPIEPNDYEVKQEWYKSKDGTDIPMFIFHKKGLELSGLNPTVLYAYGGFGHNQTPGFMKNWIPWISRGGIFAIANIRGGGEFGESWHQNGVKNKKQNSFDDFIFAGEYLISKKYTDSRHLGILGGSNGGLLVSAVGVQRPELFGAVCSKVPLTDMVRFHKFGMAMRWIHEYGNPEIKEELENILKWSPYHNVKSKIKYPDFLLTTAVSDTRVEPFHSRKMGAILQDSSEENNVLIFTEMDAGHGSGKPVIKIVENQALTLSFFADKLGLIN